MDKYFTVIEPDIVGETEITVNGGANSYQITIIPTYLGDDTQDPVIPPAENVVGTLTFEGKATVSKEYDVPYEPIVISPESSTSKVIDFASTERTFLVKGFFLSRIKVIPDNDVAHPFTIIIQQGVS